MRVLPETDAQRIDREKFHRRLREINREQTRARRRKWWCEHGGECFRYLAAASLAAGFIYAAFFMRG